MSASYHDTVNVLQAHDATARAPFERSAWFALLAGESTHQACAITAQNGSARAALALQRDGATLRSLTNWYSFRWQPLGDSTLLPALAHELRSHGAMLEFEVVSGEDELAQQLADALRKAGWWVELSEQNVNHLLKVDGRSFDEFMADRPGTLRSTVKRKAKHVTCAISDRFDPDEWAAYEKIYAESWKPEEGAPDLLRRFAEQEGAAGRLRLGIARHQGRPVAAQFWTVEGGTAWIHKLSYVEDAKKMSPGTVLSAALFQRAIDHDGVEWIDYGTGNDGYKRDWMERKRTLYNLRAGDPRQPAAWKMLARMVARNLASRLGAR